MTSHVINLNQLKRFDIIIYLKVIFSLIIYYLIYLTYLTNIFNQLILK